MSKSLTKVPLRRSSAQSIDVPIATPQPRLAACREPKRTACRARPQQRLPPCLQRHHAGYVGDGAEPGAGLGPRYDQRGRHGPHVARGLPRLHGSRRWRLGRFVISLDDVVITEFVKSAGQDTLPTYMLGQLRRAMTPEMNAISTVFLLISIGIVTIFFFVSRKRN